MDTWQKWGPLLVATIAIVGAAWSFSQWIGEISRLRADILEQTATRTERQLVLMECLQKVTQVGPVRTTQKKTPDLLGRLAAKELCYDIHRNALKLERQRLLQSIDLESSK